MLRLLRRSPSLAKRIRALITDLRRGIDREETWREFRALVEPRIEAVCRELDTRRLVSVCDTYADYGGPLESRNALMVSLLANLEKTSQSFLLWRLDYADDAFEVPAGHRARKTGLWDGMDTFHVEIGDVTNGLFGRMDRMMSETPIIERIYREVVSRLARHRTILGTLNRHHGHVFENNTYWRRDPAYDRFRRDGQIPSWKTDD